MSLILMEGFEHYHPSSTNLSRFGAPYFIGNYGVSSTDFPANTTPLSGFPLRSSANLLHTWDGGRKGGKAVGVLADATTSNIPRGYASFTFLFPKSRSVFLGFGLKATSHLFMIVVQFGRFASRNLRTADVSLSWLTPEPLGGCKWIERGSYADLEWHFVGQPIKYGQIFHNRNIRNNDWHYFQFGTTIYGNSISDPTAWAEARVATISSRAEHIRTAPPGSEADSYINCVSINVFNSANQAPGASYWMDDVYVCNDEGLVNNNFLGGCFVRSTTPQYQGELNASIISHANFRHEAVGPSYIGDPTSLPSPLPTPEESPHFIPWGSPSPSRLIIPSEMGRQNFAVHDINFQGASPRIFGVSIDVIANMQTPAQARGILAPIKTIGSTSHAIFEPNTDMLRHEQSLSRMILENPRAHEAIDVSDIDWSADAINASHYGFEVRSVVEQVGFDAKWNPDLLRYPITHEQSVEEFFGVVEFTSRHWEEFASTAFEVEDHSRWDWACRAFDDMSVFDESPSPPKALYLTGWSNTRLDDSILQPEEYIRDFFGVEGLLRWDSVARVEEELGCVVFAYHEWVEELRVWLDPYDHVERSWGAAVFDQLGVEVSDIFNGHFDVDEELFATIQVRSNHELLEETLYCNSWAQHGVLLYAEDEFNLEADHHNGDWVEQFPESLVVSSGILTRHWRFEFFWFVCVGWWNIGVVEQPIDYLAGERNPCDVKNDNIIDAYKSFFGVGGYYDEVVNELKIQWLHLGGNPELDFYNVRWANFDTFVFDGMGNVVDMLDANGHSIIEAVM